MSTRKSFLYSFLDRYFALAISTVSSMVIARLLTPREIGVFSVTMVLLNYVATFRDLGAGQYLVQEKELTDDRIRAVWAVQLGQGLLLAALIALAAWPVARFYNEPSMFEIMLVVALNYAINPFGSITYAWLMREMVFQKLAIMRAGAALVGAIVAIGLAYERFGPLSLAFGAMASTLANALIATTLRPRGLPWLPGLKEVRRVLGFGTHLTGNSLLAVISGTAPELLLGKWQSLTAAGLYSRGMGLVSMFDRMFSDAVNTVCMPWFAAEQRESGTIRAPFMRATAYMVAMGASFCLAVALLAHPVIRLLYGGQWDAAVDFTRLLALATLLNTANALSRTALVAAGQVTRLTRLTAVNTVFALVCYAVGAWHGLLALGVAHIVSSSFTTVRLLLAMRGLIRIDARSFAAALARSLGVAAMTALAPVAAVLMFGLRPEQPLPSLIVGGGGGAVLFLVALFALRHPLRDEFLRLFAKVRSAPG